MQNHKQAEQSKAKQRPAAATAVAAAAEAKQWNEWSLNAKESKVNQSYAQFSKAKQRNTNPIS